MRTKVTDPLEKEVEAKVCSYAKSKGCLAMKFSSPARRAVPDRMIVTPQGVIGFLELKRRGQKPTPQQTYELARLTRYGCNATWVDSVEGGIRFIDGLLKLRPGVGFIGGHGDSNRDEIFKGGSEAVHPDFLKEVW